MKSKKELLEALRLEHPDIAIEVEWTEARDFQWDGDGPDPVDEGMTPFDVDVKAMSIANGDLLVGTASLGGTYDEPDGTQDPEIHGYFPQMLREALKELGTTKKQEKRTYE